MHDPDVILGVDAEADHLAEDPVVRQRLGPERIDFEPRRLERAPVLRARPSLEHVAGDAERERSDGDERRPDEHDPVSSIIA